MMYLATIQVHRIHSVLHMSHFATNVWCIVMME